MGWDVWPYVLDPNDGVLPPVGLLVSPRMEGPVRLGAEAWKAVRRGRSHVLSVVHHHDVNLLDHGRTPV